MRRVLGLPPRRVEFCASRLARRTKAGSARAGLDGAEQVAAASPGQLFKLCVVVSIPFVGFGIADNAIMIIAGDAIDNHLGTLLGISTMAAAGFGNLISDVFGIGAGGAIERWCEALGVKEPPLTKAQLASAQVRRVRGLASVLGISVGCLIGMAPLLFITDRKKLYFNEKELRLYQTFFQPFGVTPQSFFELMKDSRWRKKEEGSVLIEAGKPCNRVILIHQGRASAHIKDVDGGLGLKLYNYKGRFSQPSETDRKEGVRGSIIGGSALVDGTVLGLPYPNCVVATEGVEYVEWNIEKLREQMKLNKTVEAAVFSTLYLDLVEGLKQQNQRASEGVDKALTPASLGLLDDRSGSANEFVILVGAVLADGRVHDSERTMVREFMASRGITSADLLRNLEHNGWTAEEWELGEKKDMKEMQSKDLREKIRSIPGLIRSAGVRSRLSNSTPGADSGPIEK